MHVVEQLMRGGHFAAFCSFLAEVGHKDFIKKAATLSRTEASYNASQDNMLTWVLWQSIFTAVIDLISESTDTDPPAHHPNSQDGGSDTNDSDNNTQGVQVKIKELCQLAYMDTWSQIGDPPDKVWLDTFISKRVRVTPKVLLSLMCRKLGMPVTQDNRKDLLTQLQWRCYGALSETRRRIKRKFVGISSLSRNRRDFVRIQTPTQTVGDDGRITIHDVCWSAQILMFVHVSGFVTPDLGIALPSNCRNTQENTSSVRFALVRWLAPHPMRSFHSSTTRRLM